VPLQFLQTWRKFEYFRQPPIYPFPISGVKVPILLYESNLPRREQRLLSSCIGRDVGHPFLSGKASQVDTVSTSICFEVMGSHRTGRCCLIFISCTKFHRPDRE